MAACFVYFMPPCHSQIAPPPFLQVALPLPHKQQVLELLLQCVRPTGMPPADAENGARGRQGSSPWSEAGVQLHGMHALQVRCSLCCLSFYVLVPGYSCLILIDLQLCIQPS